MRSIANAFLLVVLSICVGAVVGVGIVGLTAFRIVRELGAILVVVVSVSTALLVFFLGDRFRLRRARTGDDPKVVTCDLCSRNDRPCASMRRGEELFLGGHEAAWFASCAECGQWFAELFLEVYDDLRTYYVPLTVGEADALRQQFKGDVEGAFASLNPLCQHE